jgi:hypothetical protein
MAKQEVTPVQVQMAAAAGVKLLQVEDLPVPLSVAKSGALGVLEGLLNGIAKGELAVGEPQAPAPQIPVAPPEAPPAENNGGDDADPAMAPVESEG